MIFIQHMSDGSFGRHGAGPVKIVRKSDGEEFAFMGIRRKRGRTFIVAGTEKEWAEFDVGPEKNTDGRFFDVNEASPNAVDGFTIIFHDYLKDIFPGLHPSVQARVVGHRTASVSEFPADYTFRLAWRDTVKSIEVHMPTARDIWRDKMREARAGKLAALDAEYMRADEAGDVQGKKSIAAKKQVLRDVTSDPAIESAQTPEALKAVWPAALG